ncbi:hypothetical protein Btru_058524 [Bulinus truncatus]|nr:hypothetical protein Btru_058524 [Bulinus truncatus]
MSKEYENALRVISKAPDKRYDSEIHQLVPWLRSKAKLFRPLKADMLADILRNCDYVTKNRDDVIIKQGDVGDCFYIVLHGKVTIYILNKDQMEGEVDDNNFDNILQYTKDGHLDRVKLGYCVTSLESGAPFGDVALISDDNIRTASIVADERTDLLVVDRALYNRSVKEVMAKEFQEKTNFIKNNPLFSTWSPKYRKQLAMALYKDAFAYESALARQGDRTAFMYFILRGQVEIQVDTSQHPQQYPQIFKSAKENEVDKLIKKESQKQQPANHNKHSVSHNHYHNNNNHHQHLHIKGHSNMKRRDAGKAMRLCHLGVNESVGDVEMTMDLQTYMQTAICKEHTEVLVLEHKHYERLFTRRHPRTIDAMRDEIGVRLSSRLFLLHSSQDIPFVRYLIRNIESRNKPQPQADKNRSRELHTVSTAEREFLNHKGPLIDLNGPGSVFFLINLREKTRQRVQAKRGDRLDRLVPTTSRSAVMTAASNQMNSLPDTRILCDRVISSQARSFRDIQESIQPKEEEADMEQQEEQNNRAHSRPISGFSHDADSLLSHDAKLRILEEKMRDWLQTDNPRGRPQVAQLRRLVKQDLDFQPKPGNRVFVRRKGRSPQPSLDLESSLTESSSNLKDASRSKAGRGSKMSDYKILLTN